MCGYHTRNLRLKLFPVLLESFFCWGWFSLKINYRVVQMFIATVISLHLVISLTCVRLIFGVFTHM